MRTSHRAVKRVVLAKPDQWLGWQGFTIPLPDGWSLAAFSGDWNAGYLRAEDPAGVSLELKWKNDRSSPSLKGVLKSYLRQLNRTAGRKGDDVELHEKPKALPSVPHGGGISRTFRWRTDVTGVGAVWHCLSCRRIVLAQVTSAENDAAEAAARAILPAIEDHPEGETCRWSVYGFAFEAPKEYRLEKQSLRSGHLSLELRSRGRRIVVERYGPANVLLKRDRLSDWATSVKPIFQQLKPFRYRKTIEAGANGHSIVRVAGRRKNVKDLLVRMTLGIVRIQPPDALLAWVWRCEEANRIYLVMAEDRPRVVESAVTDVAATIECHGAGEAATEELPDLAEETSVHSAMEDPTGFTGSESTDPADRVEDPEGVDGSEEERDGTASSARKTGLR